MSKLKVRPTAWLDKRGRKYSFECVACERVWAVSSDRKLLPPVLDYLTSRRFRCLKCQDKASEWPVIPANLNAMAKAAVFAGGNK